MSADGYRRIGAKPEKRNPGTERSGACKMVEAEGLEATALPNKIKDAAGVCTRKLTACQIPTDLLEIVCAWARLPDALRMAILTIVRTQGGRV